MHGWRDLVDGFRDAITTTAVAGRPAPTAPFGDAAEEGGRPALPGLGAQDPVVRDILLARLRRRDPAFDPDAFVAGAVAAFLAVEQAWTDLDPQRSRTYLSAQLWCSHRSRMELYALHGRRNRLDGLTVRSASIAAAECGDGPDRLSVRIAARSTDYDVDASGAIVRGDRLPFDWTEDWVLQRAATSTTPAGGGVLAQRCPGCGAPLQLDAEGCCATCRAPVMDGSRDWVVVAVQRCDAEQRRLDAVLGVRILSEDDGRGRPVTRTAVLSLPGADADAAAAPPHARAALAVLAAADPDFVPGELCDHARNAFSALRQAWAAMDAERARPYLSEPAWAALQQSIDDLRSRGLHRLADDPLVDAVRISSAADADGFLTAVCEVTAELVDADADAGGALVRGGSDLVHATCALTFRRHDMARSPGSGVTLLRCPRCGAPLRAAVLEPCPYCRQAVADGGGDWALVEVGPLSPASPVPVDSRPPSPPAADPDGVADAASLAPLLAADPSLNPHDVVACARAAFFTVEASTAHLDPGAAAAVLTPAALAAHSDRLGRLRAAGDVLRLSFLDLTSASAADGTLQPDGSMRITVRLSVSGEVTELDGAGAYVSGQTAPGRWEEDWELVRQRPGAPWLVDAMRPASAASAA